MKVSFLTVMTVIGTAAAVVAAIAAVWAAYYAVIGTHDTERFISAQQERWTTEDRPKVVAQISPLFEMIDDYPVPGKYKSRLVNNGKEDAINVQVKIAATDLDRTVIRNLLPQKVYEIPKLRNGMSEEVNTGVENDQDFIVVCVEYTNDRGMPFADRPTFYATGLQWPRNEHEPRRGGPLPIKAWEDAKLSDGFSCGAL